MTRSAGTTRALAQFSLAALLAQKRPAIMGVLNITPDSFSDGGRFLEPDAAITQARLMIADGADIVDVGAESTRPYGGAQSISEEEERARLTPVLGELVRLGRPVSIDTMKAGVADWALKTGAAIVNDVWGLQHDPDMARVVAAHRAPVIIMHNRQAADPSLDIMADIAAFFERSLAVAAQAGISREQIALDPGIGFGKTPEQSIVAIAKLDHLAAFGLPILIGLSRKRFIASIVPSEPSQRLAGSIAANLLAIEKGAAIVRTHDVADTIQALRVAEALRSAM